MDSFFLAAIGKVVFICAQSCSSMSVFMFAKRGQFSWIRGRCHIEMCISCATLHRATKVNAAERSAVQRTLNLGHVRAPAKPEMIDAGTGANKSENVGLVVLDRFSLLILPVTAIKSEMRLMATSLTIQLDILGEE